MSRPSIVIVPSIELVEAHDQVHERRLAGARRPDDRDRATRLGDQREIGDQRPVRVVGERDVRELDAPASAEPVGLVGGDIRRLLIGVEQLEHALG